MTDKLTLKERLLIEEETAERKRRSDLTYVEKKVKDQLDRVIVELNGNESGAITRLASRYDRLDKAIKVMGKKRDELNAKIKGEAEELFAAEDVVLTRVIETVSFTLTVSKKSKVPDKVQVDYESIAAELAKLIPEELQAKVEEITAAYTKITPQADKSPALSVKAKVNEGLLADLGAGIVKIVRSLIKSVTSWALKYDRKLAALKRTAKLA